MSEARITIEGWSMECSGHNYITLYYDGRFVHCFDNTTTIGRYLMQRTMTLHNTGKGSFVSASEKTLTLVSLSSPNLSNWLNACMTILKKKLMKSITYLMKRQSP